MKIAKSKIKKVLSLFLTACMVFGVVSATDLIGRAQAADPLLYTITYNANGGINAPDTQTKQHDHNIRLSDVIPTRAGFIFVGWATSSAAANTANPNYNYSWNVNNPWYGWNDGSLPWYGWNANNPWYGWNDGGLPWYGSNYNQWANLPYDSERGYFHPSFGWSFTPWNEWQGYLNYSSNANWWQSLQYDPVRGYYHPSFGWSLTPWNEWNLGVNWGNYYDPIYNAGYGWGTVTYLPGDYYSGNANLSLWAVWRPRVIGTVTFNAGGGTVTPASAAIGTNGRLSALPTPVRAGHTFRGWFTAQTGGTQVTTATVFTQSATIFARWSGGHTITFNPNGGMALPTADATRTTADGKVANLPQPTRAGHTFAGWYTAASGGTRITTDTVFTQNTTVYAAWTTVGASSVQNRRDDITAAANRNNGMLITIPMTLDSTTIPRDILAIIRGRDVRLALDFGIFGVVTINGRDINNANSANDLNLGLQYIKSTGVMISGYNIPKSVVDSVNGHQVKVGLGVVEVPNSLLTVNMGAAFSGMNAFLCSYNAGAGRFEVVSSAVVDVLGNVTVRFDRTGDYILIARRFGDITGTGSVTANDALEILKAVTGLTTLDPVQSAVASSSQSGTITANDALNILKYVTGMTGGV